MLQLGGLIGLACSACPLHSVDRLGVETDIGNLYVVFVEIKVFSGLSLWRIYKKHIRSNDDHDRVLGVCISQKWFGLSHSAVASAYAVQRRIYRRTLRDGLSYCHPIKSRVNSRIFKSVMRRS